MWKKERSGSLRLGDLLLALFLKYGTTLFIYRKHLPLDFFKKCVKITNESNSFLTQIMKDEPVIQSLLDVDFYKFTMGQLIFLKHPHVEVEFTFINRTSAVRLADHIDIGELRENLEHCRDLRFAPQELHYLMGTYEYNQPMFSVEYIQFLSNFALPNFSLGVSTNGEFVIKFKAPWAYVSHWETICMSIVNELYYRSLTWQKSRFEKEVILSDGRLRLHKKIKQIRPTQLSFSDFGTRRRYSRDWQDEVVNTLCEELPGNFKGTSNVYLAQKYGVMPVGTNAHELPMVYSGIYYDQDETDPTFSQRQVLLDWEELYSKGLSIFLPDTFGSDWFFKNVVTNEQLMRWKGSRQDSGDPIEYAHKRINEYRKAGIMPEDKLIVFADGLNVARMLDIFFRFHSSIQTGFGWGTDLTNDMGFSPVSIVAKPTSADGHDVAKLSDNIGKGTGSPHALDRAKRLVDYKNQFFEIPVS